MAESDEADVFLDSRGSKGEADLSKNALVSGTSALIRASTPQSRANPTSDAPSPRVFQGHLDHDN